MTNESNTARIITLNDYSDVTDDVKDRILNNDLDVLKINYNCNANTNIDLLSICMNYHLS